MSVRKRQWTTASGEVKEAWIVDYIHNGKRHAETFARKKDADARHAEVKVNRRKGIHVAPSKSVTVRKAVELWLKSAEADELQRTTLKNYEEESRLHVVPFLGDVRLTEITAATVLDFADRLRKAGRSATRVRMTLRTLGSILADAQTRGLVAHNAVRDLRNGRGLKRTKAEQKTRLKVGVDIPTTAEVKAIIHNAPRRWRPFLVTAIFTGLRASELRGLRWADVDLKKGELHVRQRADRYGTIDKPKSKAGERTVPFGPFVANTLKEWKLRCPKGERDLVFPNGAGKVENLSNLVKRALKPAQPDGAKYTGMHCLRHFYASWCINSTADGGQGLPPKVVQERLGHSSITMTFDRYGHLFPRGDDSKQLAAAEKALLA